MEEVGFPLGHPGGPAQPAAVPAEMVSARFPDTVGLRRGAHIGAHFGRAMGSSSSTSRAISALPPCRSSAATVACGRTCPAGPLMRRAASGAELLSGVVHRRGRPTRASQPRRSTGIAAGCTRLPSCSGLGRTGKERVRSIPQRNRCRSVAAGKSGRSRQQTKDGEHFARRVAVPREITEIWAKVLARIHAA